jgi:hypothetical protein
LTDEGEDEDDGNELIKDASGESTKRVAKTNRMGKKKAKKTSTRRQAPCTERLLRILRFWN